MTNTWWYGAIAIVSVVAFLFALWRVQDRGRLLALYCFLSGLTYLAEYPVLILFSAYRYHPHVLKDEVSDNIVGAIVSDAFSIPVAGVLVAGLQLGWKGIIIVSSLIVGIEVWFVHLNLYEHVWWRFWHTGIGLLVWSAIAKFVYARLGTKVTMPLRFVVLYCTNLLIQASAVFVLASLLHAYRYEIGWFPDKSQDHIAFATAYILFLSFIFTSLVTFNVRWIWRIAVILLLTLINSLLAEYGILHMSARWSLIHFIFLRIVFVAVLDAFNRFVLNRSNQTPC